MTAEKEELIKLYEEIKALASKLDLKELELTNINKKVRNDSGTPSTNRTLSQIDFWISLKNLILMDQLEKMTTELMGFKNRTEDYENEIRILKNRLNESESNTYHHINSITTKLIDKEDYIRRVQDEVRLSRP